MSEKKVAKIYGKVCKLPKDTDAKLFMEKIKIPRNKLWYVIVEKQDNELHIIKCNEDGKQIIEFVEDMINFHLSKCTNDTIRKQICQIKVVGNGKFTEIKNIPNIQLTLEKDGQTTNKSFLSKLMEDLIKLL